MRFIKTALLTLFHPITAFEYIKSDREHFDYSPPFIIFIAVVLTQAFSIFYTHFPLSSGSLRYTDIIYEIAILFLPILTWAVASYAITTIIDGEAQFRESLSAVFYSMMPYIVIMIPLTIFSRIIEYEQRYFYYVMEVVMWIWILLLFFVNVKVMNHYTFGKTIFIVLISLFTMLIIWATLSLFMAISAQFVTFIKEVFVEIKLLVI